MDSYGMGQLKVGREIVSQVFVDSAGFVAFTSSQCLIEPIEYSQIAQSGPIGFAMQVGSVTFGEVG